MSASSRGIEPSSQASRVENLLRTYGLMRASELRAHGIAPTTLSRMSADGAVVRLGRGLYQLADAPMEEHHTIAEVAKRVPRGVICLVSALAFHGLTDQLPKRVWIAIGRKDWAPKIGAPKIRIVRLADDLLRSDVETQTVEGVEVKVFSPLRTVVDLFRQEKMGGLPVAVEGLRELLRTRAATAGEVAERADAMGVWSKMRPYVETLAANA